MSKPLNQLQRLWKSYVVGFNYQFTAYLSARHAIRFHAASGWLRARAHIHTTFFILAVFFCAPVTIAYAQDKPLAPMEDSVKAAFLYKFCLYIEWPSEAFASADSPFVFGVVASDDFIAELNAVVADRTINGRPVQIRRIDNDVSGVQLLFVARSKRLALPKLTAQTRGLPIVVVTDSEHGLDEGGTINFSMKNNRVSFEVALDAANRQGLHLSAQLLKVASNIRSEAIP